MSLFVDFCISPSDIDHALLSENGLETDKLACDNPCLIAKNTSGDIFGCEHGNNL